MRTVNTLIIASAILLPLLSGCNGTGTGQVCEDNTLYLVDYAKAGNANNVVSPDAIMEVIQLCPYGCNHDGSDCYYPSNSGDDDNQDDEADSNECHSTGYLKCQGGNLYKVKKCDDGTEKLEYGYTCPCGCLGSSTCDLMC